MNQKEEYYSCVSWIILWATKARSTNHTKQIQRHSEFASGRTVKRDKFFEEENVQEWK